jgi:hypothetical protein
MDALKSANLAMRLLLELYATGRAGLLRCANRSRLLTKIALGVGASRCRGAWSSTTSTVLAIA